VKFKRGKVFFGDSIRKEEVDGVTLFYSPNFLAAVDEKGKFQALLFEYEGNGCRKLPYEFSGTLSLQEPKGLEILAPFGFYLLRRANLHPQPGSPFGIKEKPLYREFGGVSFSTWEGR
jgi:hypothetical protein